MKWTYEAMTTSLPLYSCLKQVIKNVRENWTTSRCTKKENKCVIVANKIKSTCRAACFLIVLIPMKLPTRSLLFKALPHIPQCHQPASWWVFRDQVFLHHAYFLLPKSYILSPHRCVFVSLQGERGMPGTFHRGDRYSVPRSLLNSDCGPTVSRVRSEHFKLTEICRGAASWAPSKSCHIRLVHELSDQSLISSGLRDVQIIVLLCRMDRLVEHKV